MDQPWSVRMANSYIDRHPGAVTYDSASPKRSWDYEQGLMLEAFHQLWLKTGNKKYLDFIKNNIDQYVDANGNIRTYYYHKFRLDDINTGTQLLFLYQMTK